jgi:hypothetical protein
MRLGRILPQSERHDSPVHAEPLGDVGHRLAGSDGIA